MKKSVKVLSLFTIVLLISGYVPAQSSLVLVNDLINDVRKVIEDYPNCFANIRGGIIVQNPQSSEYECSIKINGAEESSITLYSSKSNNSCSWQAIMLTTEDFIEAKKKYKIIYDQLHNQELNLGGNNALRLKGVYDEPKDEKKFTSTLLSLSPEDERFKGLKVEILLQYEPMEWKLKVLVYNKEREDDERGKRIDN